LEEQSLGVDQQLDALIGIFRVEVVQAVGGQDDGRGDVVLNLHFVGGIEVGTKLEDTPGTFGS